MRDLITIIVTVLGFSSVLWGREIVRSTESKGLVIEVSYDDEITSWDDFEVTCLLVNTTGASVPFVLRNEMRGFAVELIGLQGNSIPPRPEYAKFFVPDELTVGNRRRVEILPGKDAFYRFKPVKIFQTDDLSGYRVRTSWGPVLGPLGPELKDANLIVETTLPTHRESMDRADGGTPRGPKIGGEAITSKAVRPPTSSTSIAESHALPNLQASASPTPEFTADHKSLLGELDKGVANKDTDAITRARVQIESLPPRTPDRRFDKKERDIKLHLLLAALQKVDLACDKTFDPTELLRINIGPPRGKDGRTYDSGISPKSISDPEVRGEYERMLAASEKRNAWFEQQMRLKTARDGFLATVEAFTAKRFARDAQENNSVSTAIESQIRDPELRAEIRRRLGEKKR